MIFKLHKWLGAARFPYFVFGLFAAVLIVMTVPVEAQAHILRVNNGTSAELHIEPDDAPTAGTRTTYLLSFQQSDGTFSLERCTCSIAFIKDGTIVAQHTLAITNATLSRDTFTLKEPGMYTFRVSGSPSANATFMPFTLEYAVRVGRNATDSAGISPLGWIGIGSLMLIVVAYASFQMHRRRPREDG